MRTSFFQALPPYRGGKRRARPAILGLVENVYPQSSWLRLVFCDAFVGGGSVALAAKAFGCGQILANDLATRSVIVGRALLENTRARLSRNDVVHLLQVSGRGPGWHSSVLERLPALAARFLTRAWSHAEAYPKPREDSCRKARGEG